MSRTRLMLGSCFAVLLGLLALGCAGTAQKAVPVNRTTGEHPTNWIPTHYAEYVKTPEQCRTCHGSTAEPALAGGISKVSCFTCHPNGINHPAGWADPRQHGRLGAMAALNLANPVAMVSFSHCAKCHGSTFDNGLTVSCKACHTKAPHPVKPWTGTTVTLSNHIFTNQTNVPECFKCHAAGANSTVKPLTTPPAGTAPGCLNDTMCHSTSIHTPGSQRTISPLIP